MSVDTRHHIHEQQYPYRFQSQVYAPEKGTTVPRFAVEVMVYVSSTGWDIIDPFIADNRIMVAFRDYVRMKELMGYKHLGLSSDELTKMMEKIWEKKIK